MPLYHCHKPVFRPKMAIFCGAGKREGGKPPYDLNLVMVSSLASKCQVGMPFFQPFYDMKLKTSKFKVLAF